MKDLELLKAAIEFDGSAAAVGRRIKRSKSTISLLLNEKYPCPEILYEKINKVYNFINNEQVLCPAIKDKIHIQVCRRYSVAVKEKKELGGAAFEMVKTICPYCRNSKE